MKELIKKSLQTNEGIQIIRKIIDQDELVKLLSYTIQIRNDYKHEQNHDSLQWFNYFESIVMLIESRLTQLELSGKDWGDY